MQDRTITLIDNDGKEVNAVILFTHHSDDFEKDYVVFQVESGEVTAASYTEGENGKGELAPVETDDEWDMLEELLEEYAEQLEKAESNGCGCAGGCGGCAGCEGSCDGECDCDKE